MRRRRFAVLLASSLAAVAGAPATVAFAAQPRPVGTILVADLQANAIFAIDPTTGAQSVVASGGPFVDPEGLVVDPATCDAIVSDAGAGAIFRVSLVDGSITAIASGRPLVHPVGGVLDGQGRLLSSDEEAFDGSTGGVIAVDLKTGTQTVVASGGNFVTPLGVALAPDGTTYVADADSFADTRGGVIAIDRSTGTQTVVSQDPGPSQHPQGILWWDGRLLLTDMTRGGLFAVDTATGAQSPVVVGNGLSTPREIEGDGAGTVLIADAGARSVFRIDLATGVVQTVSSLGQLLSPFGIAKVPACPDTTPAQGGGQPPAAAPTPGTTSAAPRDTTPPKVSLRSVPRTARVASFVGGVALRLSVDGAADVRVELRRPTRDGHLGSRLGTATRVHRRTAGPFTVRATARRTSLRRLLRTSRRLSIRIVAKDAAGNTTVRRRSLRVSGG
jgi:streptogramin lyase